MSESILWRPERSCCHTCGEDVACARRYTKEYSHYVFCINCWREFLLECKVCDSWWVNKINDQWMDDTAFILNTPEKASRHYVSH